MSGLDSPSRRQLPGDNLIFGGINYIQVSVDMSSATWNTVATHEVFTVTGTVRMRFLILCTETLTDAADGAYIQFGHESDTDLYIGSTGAAGAGGDTISANTMWLDATPGDVSYSYSGAILDHVITGGKDVGYEITGADLTDGTLVFKCWWEPLDSTGNVVAGAGGVLV